MSTVSSLRRFLATHWPEVLFVVAVVAWLAWVLTSPLWSGRQVPLTSPYISSPLMLLAGIGLGRLSGRLRRAWLLPELLACVCVVAMLVTLYGNAVGAVGVQAAALAALMALTHLPGAGRTQRAWTAAVLVLVVLLAGMLVRRSDAAALLAAPLVFGATLLVTGLKPPSRRRLVAAAGLVLAWGALVVVWLGRLESWPAWLSARTVLSKSRHTLWGDALQLWRDHPVSGGGVGSFTASSELASSSPDLATAHSSLLQVGSELGLVGVLLFLLVAGCALLTSLKRSGKAASMAVAAWTALGLHSLIDHLLEFPVVMVLVGTVLGWAGSQTGLRTYPPK